jgi:phenylacetate 2-hydroxylase
MVSAGLDTVPGNFTMGLGYLSTPHGQETQQKLYDEIMAVYPNNAWEVCLKEEKVPYLTAFVKETLRFWTVLPICLPRVNIKDMVYDGVTIPAGTTFLMVVHPASSYLYIRAKKRQNAYAAAYDPTHFAEPHKFSPERYLVPIQGISHFAYGCGSRTCIGLNLANRELYTLFLRLIVAFRVLPAEREEDKPVIDALDCNKMMTGLTTDPKDFKVKLVCRDRGMLEEWLKGSEERTKEL